MCECLTYDDGEMHLCVVCADAWRENEKDMAKLRAENEKQGELIKGAVHAIRAWAAEEDGIPDLACPVFNAMMLHLGWEYSTKCDIEALRNLAALARTAEGTDTAPSGGEEE